MNGTVSNRQQGSPRHKRSYRRKSVRKNAKMTDTAASPGGLFAFTMDADTGRIVKFEALDSKGTRRALSEQEKAKLAARGRSENPLEAVLERAFEAGIACVLGDEAGEEGPEETDDDAELRHLLLSRLIEHSAVGHLIRREALNRAILEALVQRSIQPAPATVERGRPAPTRTH